MTLWELVNSDVGAVGEQLRQSLAWWGEELMGMVPYRLRQGLRRARPLVELDALPGPVRIWNHGRFIEHPVGLAGRPLAVDVALPTGAALVREVNLPLLSRSDTARMIGLDLDRLTPFRPDQVYVDFELGARDLARGRQRVWLAVILRADAEAALERAVAHGLAPHRLGIRAETVGVRFDFLKALRAAGRGGRPDRTRLWWWTAVATLAALNIGLMVYRDADDVASLRRAVTLQRPTVALALRLRQRVIGETAARKALLARREHGEPLKLVDAISRAFPPPQWVERLEWNGRTVRIVGYRTAGFDVVGAMRGSSMLQRPRAFSAASPTSNGALQSFDVIAEPAGPLLAAPASGRIP